MLRTTFQKGAKKSLGQNFLRCRWVADTMVKTAAISKNDTVIEIGPGAGALTRPLAAAAQQVIAIEKDEALAQNLREILAKEGITNAEVIEGDILKLPKKQFRNLERSLVVSNIPYYLTSRLFRYFLESPPRPKTIVFTVQKEVARRAATRPPNMNMLAISIQAFGKVEIIKRVPRECFSPKPDVDSAIIRISDISDGFFRKNSVAPEKFFALAHAAFLHKRKMLSSSLKRIVPPETFEHAGIHKNSRPQELGIEEWKALLMQLNKT